MRCTNKPHTNRELSTKQSISGIEEQMYVPVSCPFTKNASVNILCNQLLAITVLSQGLIWLHFQPLLNLIQSCRYSGSILHQSVTPSKFTVCVVFFLPVKEILIFDVPCLVKSKNSTTFSCISNLIAILQFIGLCPVHFSQFFCI